MRKGAVSAILLFALLLISFAAIYPPQSTLVGGATTVPSPLFWFGLVLFVLAAILFLRNHRH